MRTQVVHHNNITFAKCRQQLLLHPRQKYFAVDRTIDNKSTTNRQQAVPSSRHDAMPPKMSSPKTTILQWPCGTKSMMRWPISVRPQRGVMFVLDHVATVELRPDNTASRKTNFSTSMTSWISFHSSRCSTTSSRCCSAAWSVFFPCDFQVFQEITHRRDAWCYNFSQENLSQNMTRMIDFYNEQISLDLFGNHKKFYSYYLVFRFLEK